MTKRRQKVQAAAPPRVQRTHLTITAATATARPTAWVKQLKAGEYSWGVETPAASTKAAVDKCLAEAARMRAQMRIWEQEKWDETTSRLETSAALRRRGDGGQQ